MLDLHMHSEYSNDAKPDASVDAICRAAVARGLSTIALTDHRDYYYCAPPLTFDTAAQKRDIARCNAEFAGQLTVLAGVEMGQLHAHPQQSADYLAAFPFDMVIGSVHVRRANDTDIYFQNFAEMDCTAFLEEYFAEVLRMVRFGGFDVLAHLDYPLRVMKLPNNAPSFVGWEDRIEPILREIIDREVALEINAAGLFAWMKQVGPPRFVLDMYKNLGGTLLSIGSDSHCAPDVGRGIEACYAHAKAAGFRELTVYQNRKPRMIAL